MKVTSENREKSAERKEWRERSSEMNELKKKVENHFLAF